MEELITVKLTHKEWNELHTFILMTNTWRSSEIEAYEKLAKEKDENGNPKFVHAESNAQFFREMNERLKKIQKEINLQAWGIEV